MYQVTNWLVEYALAKTKVGIGSNGKADDQKITESARGSGIPAFAQSELTEAETRTILALKNIRDNHRALHSEGNLRETLTTAHFDTYFADALSRKFYDMYNMKVGNWLNYTYPEESPNITRAIKRFRMSQPGTLYRRREKAEAKPTSIAATKIEISVKEYARQFDVSWQLIQDDDLGEIAKTPERMFESAKRWADEFVSNLYDNATTQATLAALGAPWAITGRLTLSNLAIAINALKQRTDAQGNRIQIQDAYIVIPDILEIPLQTILQNLISYGGTGGNVLQGFIKGYFIDPYIATSGPDVPWYVFGDPKRIPVVSVARMQGWPGPVVFSKRSDIGVMTGSVPPAFAMGDYATGNIEFTVEDIMGGWDDASYVGVTDYRGLVYSSGTTP